MSANPPQQTDLIDSGAVVVHQLFRGSAEVTKSIRLGAFVLELSAAAIAAYGVLGDEALWGGWTSLVMLLVMVASTALRIWSRSTHAHAERCRCVSVRAFTQGRDVGAAVLSGLVADAPVFAERLAARLPAGNLEEYYEPTKACGIRRTQEVYAHSSFYSWRLLRQAGGVVLMVGVILAAVGAVVIYGLAVQPPAATTAGRILDVVYSLVFVALAAKAVDAGVAALVAAREARTVADGLIETSDAGRIAELSSYYDMDRRSGPLVPTFVYRLSRKSLRKEWHVRRRALDELSANG